MIRTTTDAPVANATADAPPSPSGLPDWLPANAEVLPGLRLLAARVLREPQIGYPLGEGHPYVFADIEVDIELQGAVLPPIVVTACSNNAFLGRPIMQSTWPSLEWVYQSELLEESLQQLGCTLEMHDIEEAVLSLVQWHPLVRAACRQVGRMIEEVLKRKLPRDFPRVPPDELEELTRPYGPDRYLSLPAGAE